MKMWYHLAFVAICTAVLLFLLNAPEVSTPRLPGDTIHQDRKDYPRCPSCHGPDTESAMPKDHFGAQDKIRSDHLKCYFCHKPQE